MNANLERGNELKQQHGLFKSLQQAKEANLSSEDYFHYAVACEEEIRNNITQWTLTNARDNALADAAGYAGKAR